jgi:hypothetical protein
METSMLITRRHLQIGLGLLWLADAALQFQPYMFSHDFPHHVIAGSADGQPGWVATPVLWAAHLMAAAPAVTNTLFAAVQLLLAIAILHRRTARFGLAASVLWAMSVWYLGEGLGGLASGHATLITGAPGAALLYAMLALLAWPHGASLRQPGQSATAVGANAVFVAWAGYWVGGAILQLLPGQNTGSSIANAITGSADDAPDWLATADRTIGRVIPGTGTGAVMGLAFVMLFIGIAALFRSRVARWAAVAGMLLATVLWLFGQSLGGISTGMATDPNAGPLVALLALALLSATTPVVRPVRLLTADPIGVTRRGPHRSLTAGNTMTTTTTNRRLSLLATVPILLAGCVAASSSTSRTAPSTFTSSGAPMEPGMKMPDGTTMPETLTAAGPSQSARMVCSDEIRKDVATLLALPATPTATSTWTNHVYTCTYALADGPLVLSVTESGTIPAARAHFTSLQKRVGTSQPIRGLDNLGLPAFETPNGTVAFVKDDKTLQVDATGLPQHIGTPNFDRAHLAYTIATDVLGCWNGK